MERLHFSRLKNWKNQVKSRLQEELSCIKLEKKRIVEEPEQVRIRNTTIKKLVNHYAETFPTTASINPVPILRDHPLFGADPKRVDTQIVINFSTKDGMISGLTFKTDDLKRYVIHKKLPDGTKLHMYLDEFMDETPSQVNYAISVEDNTFKWQDSLTTKRDIFAHHWPQTLL